MFYQGLAGAWPFDLNVDNEDEMAAFVDRMAAFMLKAIKEAKVKTSWTAPNKTYEQAVEAFVRRVLEPSRNGEFLADFACEQARLEVAGALNSFAQTLMKLTVPGVPDIFQGAELWELSLVDPDNRRQVNFEERRNLLRANASADPTQLLHRWQSGATKHAIISRALAARREAPSMFTSGSYTPLTARGRHADSIVAFSRSDGGGCAITIVPVRARPLLGDSDMPLIQPDVWEDTSVALPQGPPGNWRNLFTEQIVRPDEDGRLKIADALVFFPVALLIATIDGAKTKPTS